MELRGKSISFSSYKKKAADKKEKELISNIESLESKLTDTNLNEIKNLKEELYRIRKK